jgi:hypothetical protein
MIVKLKLILNDSCIEFNSTIKLRIENTILN